MITPEQNRQTIYRKKACLSNRFRKTNVFALDQHEAAGKSKWSNHTDAKNKCEKPNDGTG